MTTIPLNSLVIPANRQRQQFAPKDIADLVASIIDKGLLHPIVVREDGVTLVAGERRYRALTQLYINGDSFTHDGSRVPANHIPVTLLGNLDPLKIREAELEENTIRVDLSWQERAKAVSELHELRVAQNPDHEVKETIMELAKSSSGSKATGVRDSLIVAEHMNNPEVAKAKSQKDAIKVVRKIEEKKYRANLSDQFDLTKSEHHLECGDMRDGMEAIPAGKFDLILTDPPYGMGADTFGDMASTGHNYEDTWENARDLYSILAVEGYRVCKAEAHIYAFCRFEKFSEISEIFSRAGWDVWTRPIIWDKSGGMLPKPDHGPRYTYECIIFCNKGNRRTLRVAPDIIRVSGDAKLLHGAQKPVDLYVDLITRTCLSGNQVLDPFAGSGTIISAATQTRCVATAFEINRENYDIGVSRLNETLVVSKGASADPFELPVDVKL